MFESLVPAVRFVIALLIIHVARLGLMWAVNYLTMVLHRMQPPKQVPPVFKPLSDPLPGPLPRKPNKGDWYSNL